jgi:hypothetical protein
MTHLFKFAENILNNLDSQTQTALSTSKNALNEPQTILAPKNGKKKQTNAAAAAATNSNDNNHIEASHLKSSYSTTNIKSSSNINHFANATLTLSASATNSSTNLSSLSSNKVNKEDELINFLNDTDTSELSNDFRSRKNQADSAENRGMKDFIFLLK